MNNKYIKKLKTKTVKGKIEEENKIKTSRLVELSLKFPQTFVRKDDKLQVEAKKRIKKSYNISFIKLISTIICRKKDSSIIK